MITRNRYDYSEDLSYQGLSTDTKPTENVGINALFLELDTGDFYYFDGTGWAKVGGGGSEPSGDGYEINNPTLTVTVENTAMLVNPLGRNFIDNDGYLSQEEITPSVGDSFSTLVFAYDGDDDYIYFADATSSSNKVNCTFDGSTSLVTITDPSKDASITLSWMLG